MVGGGGGGLGASFHVKSNQRMPRIHRMDMNEHAALTSLSPSEVRAPYGHDSLVEYELDHFYGSRRRDPSR